MNNSSIFGLSPLLNNIAPPQFTVTPLGGFGQIGMNCMLWSTKSTSVIVDCGLMFPSDFHLGIDVLIPQFDHLIANKSSIAGIVLTHGHEDHIGALPWLLPHVNVPIYGSPFTLALVKNKLREHELLDKCTLIPIHENSPVQLGDICLHFFPVSHSIIDGMAIGAETPAGKIIHTGDFKLDDTPLDGTSTDLEQFSRFAGKDGVLLLFSDSTNIESEGTSLSESIVLDNLRQVFATAKKRIIVTLFSSHIQRIQEVFDCAHETGRVVAVSGRSLVNNIETAAELGKLRIPSKLYLFSKDMPKHPDEKVVLLVTGSQGEPMSALSRIASGGHRDFTIHEGDTIILSSRLIPGNTVAVNTLINKLYRSGAHLHDNSKLPVHASGHAQRDELQAMLNASRPKFFVPVHGEYRHLVKHVQLAIESGVSKENCLIVENGSPFTITSKGITLNPEVPADYICVDGKGVGDVGRTVLKERRLLGEEGLVFVQLVLDSTTGSILFGPEVISKGFVFEQQYEHLLEEAKCLVFEILEEKRCQDTQKLQENCRIAIRRFFKKILNRDPVVILSIITV